MRVPGGAEHPAGMEGDSTGLRNPRHGASAGGEGGDPESSNYTLLILNYTSMSCSTEHSSAFDSAITLSVFAAFMFFTLCSYCWIVRTGIPETSASSLWESPAAMRNFFRFVSCFREL